MKQQALNDSTAGKKDPRLESPDTGPLKTGRPQQALRVLIVEDVPSDVELVLREMRNLDREIAHEVVDSREAFIEAVDEFGPDIVLSDYAMPAFDGMAALKILQQRKPDIPFIIVTGTQNEEVAVECMKAGAADYMIKENLRRLGPAVMAALEKYRLKREKEMAEEEVRKSRDELEDLVRERTAELEESSRKLKEEVLERRRIEEAIRKSEEQYRQVVDNANEGIILAQDETFRFVNPKFAEILGYAPQELVSKPFTDFVHPDDRQMVLDRYRKRLDGLHIPSSYSFRIFDRQGKTKWLEINSVRIMLQGRPAILSFFIDITEKVRIEDEKRKAEAQLAQAQKIEALGRFAGGIAHDLNNILYPIIINTEILIDEASPGTTQHELLSQTLNAAYRQRDLVKQILSFSRQRDQVLKETKVVPLLKDTLTFIRSTLPSTIEIRQDIDIRSDTVMGDPTQIQQVIMNLCRNAADALELQKGLIEVSLRNTRLESITANPEMKPGEYLELKVCDTGHGIPSDVMGRIFEPFYTTKRVGKGSGMGLSVVHGIVKNHGGTIAVESEPGRGSLFTVYLPLCEETPAAKGQGTAIPEEKEKILLVDDEDMILSSLQRALEKLGYLVVACRDSRDALALFEKGPGRFDLVITDLTMPGMTGITLAKRLIEVRPDVPIIMCTGFSDVIDENQAKSLGIRELILKPSTTGELKTVVARVLQTGGGRNLQA